MESHFRALATCHGYQVNLTKLHASPNKADTTKSTPESCKSCPDPDGLRHTATRWPWPWHSEQPNECEHERSGSHSGVEQTRNGKRGQRVNIARGASESTCLHQTWQVQKVKDRKRHKDASVVPVTKHYGEHNVGLAGSTLFVSVLEIRPCQALEPIMH